MSGMIDWVLTVLIEVEENLFDAGKTQTQSI